jgi:hypothetical protein
MGEVDRLLRVVLGWLLARPLATLVAYTTKLHDDTEDRLAALREMRAMAAEREDRG